MTFNEYLRCGRRLGVSRRKSAIMLGLQMLGIVFEAGALAMLLPIIEFIQSGASKAVIDTAKALAVAGRQLRLPWHRAGSRRLIGYQLYDDRLSADSVLLPQSYRQITVRRLERDIRNTAFDRSVRADVDA